MENPTFKLTRRQRTMSKIKDPLLRMKRSVEELERHATDVLSY